LILSNKSIKCLDCGSFFFLSGVEQAYFQSKRDTSVPGCCPSCRQTRKERQAADISGNNAMTHRLTAQMFSTNCARCGNRTEVPFEPRNHKAVYCSGCYDAIRAGR
jgi:CxxC-x17-CxxC domain-containing protein